MNPVNVDPHSAEQENRQLRYVGNTIPWYVHVMWILFWIGVIVYHVAYLIPALKSELLTPP